jgi:hypothetical protein
MKILHYFIPVPFFSAFELPNLKPLKTRYVSKNENVNVVLKKLQWGEKKITIQDFFAYTPCLLSARIYSGVPSVDNDQ